ncbi:MAG TPA: hypothetical protein PKN44_14665 [Bacteroidales bacterium]|nr:hypothetical protein [Bacteroidales bacterium]
MENSTDNINQVKPGPGPFVYTERECEICHDSFYAYEEAICEKCLYKKHLMENGYSESYANELLKTHMRFEEEFKQIIYDFSYERENQADEIIVECLPVLVKCHCNAMEVGWNEGYEFARKQPREFSSNIDIPAPITPRADEIRRDSRIVICDRCEGTGKVRIYNEDLGYSGPGEEQCPICNGRGRRNLLINFVFSPIKDI